MLEAKKCCGREEKKKKMRNATSFSFFFIFARENAWVHRELFGGADSSLNVLQKGTYL